MSPLYGVEVVARGLQQGLAAIRNGLETKRSCWIGVNATEAVVAWPLVGQIAATVGLTVLEQAGLEIWDRLNALGLVEYGDQLIVKEILAPS